MRLLFVTWDGPQVTYLESLFLPIFRALGPHGVDTDILQFGWGSAAQEGAIRSACEAAGCRYRAIPVRRGGGAAGAFLTAVAGARHVRAAVRDFGTDLVMPRSLMPALAVLVAGPARLPPILFDADGLAADEKVEFAGLNPRGPAYRALRWIERSTIRRSAHVLIRTEAAADILAARAGVGRDRFTIVANGRDPELFHPADPAQRAATRAELGIAPDAPLLVYAGSVGPQYCFDLIAETALAVRARRPDARLLILTGEPEAAKAALGAEASRMAHIRQVPTSAVPALLAAADAGLALRATSFSTQALAPIKLGEYLLCGLPVIGTAAVGDTVAAVREGVFLDEADGPDRAAIWLSQAVLADRAGFAQRARAVGLDRFSLARSVQDYLTALTAAVAVSPAESLFGPHLHAKARPPLT